MTRTLRSLSVFGALLVTFGAAAGVEGNCLGAAGDPAVRVVGHDWKRHVHRPWLETSNWFVEPTKNDVRGFQYRVVVRNSTRKTVRAVEWEYRFLGADGREASLHRFSSVGKIKPGAARTLTAFSVRPPTDLIIAGGAGPHLVERVSLRAVTFEDGTRLLF